MTSDLFSLKSQWKKAEWRSTETWESVNCASGIVTITQVGDGFLGRDELGMLVSQFPDTFEDCVQMMEETFDWFNFKLTEG
jgi:hypothetical protein